MNAFKAERPSWSASKLLDYAAITTQDLIARLENLVTSLHRQHDAIDPYLVLQMRTFLVSIGDYDCKPANELFSQPKTSGNSTVAFSPSNSFSYLDHGLPFQKAYQQQGEVSDPTAPFTGLSNPIASDLQRQVVEAADALHSLKHVDTQNWWPIDNGDAPDFLSFLTPTIHPGAASVPDSQGTPSAASTTDHGETLQISSSSEGVPQKGCCRTCGQDHVVTSSPDCPECIQRFRVPGKRKTFSCPICGQSYTRAATLKEHRRTHSKEKPYKCSTCSKAFTRAKDRKRHQRIHGNDKYRCALVDELANSTFVGHSCDGSFGRKDSLMAHFDTKTGARCAERYVAFFSKGLKDEELMIGSAAVCTFHDPKRPGCGREFKDNDELREHLMAPFKLHCMKDSVLRYAGILQET